MKNFIFFIYIPLVHSVSHSFKTTYTRQDGQILTKTTLDGWEINNYDWKEFLSGDKWRNYTEIRERVQEMSNQFSQSHSVHEFQRKYGCVWDNETENTHGFDEYSYDGQEFISLDLKESRYTARDQKAEPTVLKWNSDKEQVDFLKQYYAHECVYWLKELLRFSQATVKKTPGQSLTEQPLNNLTVDETKSDGSTSDIHMYIYIILAVVVIITVVAILIFLYQVRKHLGEVKFYCKKFMYYKDPHSSSSVNEDDPLAQSTT